MRLDPSKGRTPRRRTLAAAAAAVLLTAALTACGADAEQPDASPSEPSESATPSPSKSPKSPKSPSESPSKSQPAGPTLEIEIAGDEVTPVAEQVDLGVGELLTITVRSDRAGELHVHSDPERSFDFGSGSETLRLSLDKPGAVDIEEHEADALVARVLVR